jgi:hypothetical protein
MFEHLDEALHIVAGMGIPLEEALGIVYAAHAPPDEPTKPTTIGNVTYVEFMRR